MKKKIKTKRVKHSTFPLLGGGNEIDSFVTFSLYLENWTCVYIT